MLTSKINIKNDNYYSLKDRSIDKNDSYLKDEMKTKNIIITTLFENQKLLLSNSSSFYKNQNANNDTNINRTTESKFEIPKNTATIRKNVSSKKLELKNRFDALTLENKEVHDAPYISMEKNSPTTNSQSSTKPKNHTQNIGEKSSSMPHTKSKRKTTVILGDSILKKVIGKI